MDTPLFTALEPDGIRLQWRCGAQPRGYAETLREWRDTPEAALPFAAALAAVPYASFYWECPPLAAASAGDPFECVVLPAFLHRARQDAHAFADRFADGAPGDVIATFSNLGGRSVLVAPLPIAGAAVYGHLAAFVRRAPPAQVAAFFGGLAAAALEAARVRTVWVSTAGDGVAWLHGRVDPRPKYYHFTPYRRDPAVFPAVR